MTLDERGVYALGKVSDERKLAELARADVLCAPSLGRRELRHDPHRGVRRRYARDRLGHPRLSRRGARRRRRTARRLRRPARARRGSAPPVAGPPAPRAHGRGGARARRTLRLAARRRRSLDTYEQAISLADPARRRAHGGLERFALGHGFMPADLQPRVPAAAAGVAGARAAAARRPPAPNPHAAPRRPGRLVAGRSGPGGARAAARRRGARRRLAAGLQARPAARRSGADVRGHVHARDRLARDPCRRTHVAARQTPRCDAGHVHRRADVFHHAGTLGRVLARADRRAPARPRARTLPIVLGTMVSQTLLNLLALAVSARSRCRLPAGWTATTARCCSSGWRRWWRCSSAYSGRS